jgi:hypothetical protein
MEHDLEKARNMKLLLSAFEQMSSLKINFYKSEVFCFRPKSRNRSMDNYLDVRRDRSHSNI